MRRTVYVFPKPKWVDTVSCDGKPCGGAAGCGSTPTAAGNCQSEACGGSAACSLEDWALPFGQRHSDVVEVRIADYSSLRAIQESLADLNRILERNGEDLRVSLENLDLVFSQIAPIVAIGDNLAFVKKAPSEEDLAEALGLGSQAVRAD